MKLYQLRPSTDIDLTGSEFDLYRTELASLVADCLRIDRDQSFVGMWRNGEIGMTDVSFTESYGDHRFINLPTREAVCGALRKCADDRERYWMWIKSRVTCRSAFFTGDGKLYLCVGAIDPPPTPMSSRIRVLESSRFLIETDYLDGIFDLD